MRIYCINPPSESTRYVREGRCMQREESWANLWQPISLAYTTSILRNDGHEVILRDATAENWSFERMKREIEEFRPDLAIINSSVPTCKNTDIKTARIIKEINKNCVTVMVGIPPTLPIIRDELIVDKSLDICIRNEFEFTTRNLANNLKNYKKIKGITFKFRERIFNNPKAPFIDLNRLPFAAIEDLPLDAYKLPFTKEKVCMIEQSRGCPFNCAFCVASIYYGKKIRYRNAQKVVDEMEHVYKNFGIRQFFFWADTFTLARKNVIEICDEIIKRKLNVNWLANSRVDCVDRRLLEKMKRAGCWLIGFGVESCVQKILDNVGKKINLTQINRAINLCKEVGIKSATHIIFGLPGETRDTIKETIDTLKKIDPDYANFYIAIPYPGTRLYKEYKKLGYIRNYDWSKYEICEAVIDLPNLPGKEIKKLRKEAILKFYFRRCFFKRFIKEHKNLSVLMNSVCDVIKFLYGWME
ncbi:MAG: B12-binding domain-containing radical SAM protein [Candidatus Parvarchaeota archaeon]|nr:B12-binding domain-containing radical SAM protein [Candidatus Jingweiarchaeum tengchongense]MCW1298430.1 B12-binding domain-containing radical SAM protein [Candidatus Jingweiarchaeum tengchongense]MCW1310840.1 B12-binding domain-containing radical SAM protein [Candidatus Jingweiarchaeum tengchongense]